MVRFVGREDEQPSVDSLLILTAVVMTSNLPGCCLNAVLQYGRQIKAEGNNGGCILSLEEHMLR